MPLTRLKTVSLGLVFVVRLLETVFQRWLLPVFVKWIVFIKYFLIKRSVHLQFSMLRFACRDPHYITVLVWGYFEPC